MNEEIKKCESTKKRCYTGKEANELIHKAHRRCNTSKVIPKRKYYCSDCGFFHLTSKAFSRDGKSWNSGKKRKRYIKNVYK